MKLCCCGPTGGSSGGAITCAWNNGDFDPNTGSIVRHDYKASLSSNRFQAYFDNFQPADSCTSGTATITITHIGATIFKINTEVNDPTDSFYAVYDGKPGSGGTLLISGSASPVVTFNGQSFTSGPTTYAGYDLSIPLPAPLVVNLSPLLELWVTALPVVPSGVTNFWIGTASQIGKIGAPTTFDGEAVRVRNNSAGSPSLGGINTFLDVSEDYSQYVTMTGV